MIGFATIGDEILSSQPDTDIILLPCRNYSIGLLLVASLSIYIKVKRIGFLKYFYCGTRSDAVANAAHCLSCSSLCTAASPQPKNLKVALCATLKFTAQQMNYTKNFAAAAEPQLQKPQHTLS